MKTSHCAICGNKWVQSFCMICLCKWELMNKVIYKKCDIDVRVINYDNIWDNILTSNERKMTLCEQAAQVISFKHRTKISRRTVQSEREQKYFTKADCEKKEKKERKICDKL